MWPTAHRITERVTQAEVCCNSWHHSCPSSMCLVRMSETQLGYDLYPPSFEESPHNNQDPHSNR